MKETGQWLCGDEILFGCEKKWIGKGGVMEWNIDGDRDDAERG